MNNIGYFISKRNRFQPTIHSCRSGCQSTILDRGAPESYIEGMAENILAKILGSQRERDLKALGPLVRESSKKKRPSTGNATRTENPWILYYPKPSPWFERRLAGLWGNGFLTFS